MKVKFKKLHEGAKLPKRATAGSAAYDVYVPCDFLVKRGRQIIPLGFAMEMEDEYEALIDARSGFSAKGMEGYRVEMLMTRNGYELLQVEMVHTNSSRFDCDVIQGKIDADYRDGVGVIINNRSPYEFIIKAGTRIAQMTFHKVETADWEETDELSASDRSGGFCSTGTK